MYQHKHTITSKFIISNKKLLPKNNIVFKNKPIQKKYIKKDDDDVLFWYFFIILKGESEFELIQSNKFTVSKNFKIESSITIKKMKLNRKFNKTNIINNLCHEKNITVMTLAVLCSLYNINILYVVNNIKYYELFQENDTDEEQTFYVMENNNNNIELFKNINKNQLDKYTKNSIKIEGFNSNLKTLSHYKLDDLQIIASTLGFNIKSKKKQMLYDEIQNKLETTVK